MKKYFLVVYCLTLASCANLGVEPWQKQLLAKQEMTGVAVLTQKYDDHIYFSKEAASGGINLAGGGCGCN